jgi:succinate dehydrogenase/fumarate reductase flavoprotein subunit
VLVVGSGAGGLCAALTAAYAGLDVLVIEKDKLFGGTTAHSEGMIWIPKNHHAEAVGKKDDAAAALTYLEGAAGNHLDRAKSAVYVERAAEMLSFIENKSRVRYALAGSLDYFSHLPGATIGTRSLRVEPMDGRTLGAAFEQVRPPLKSTLAFGGMTVIGPDLPDALKAHHSLRSFGRMVKLVLRYGIDRLQGYSRGTRIGNGHAVVASLVEALKEKGVRLKSDTALRELNIEHGHVVGATVLAEGEEINIKASRGVILATGGFSNDLKRQAKVYPAAKTPINRTLLTSSASTGDGITAAESAGAAFSTALWQPAAWTPASQVPQAGGGHVAFPHYIDRNKPGFIAVDCNGKRFANEASVYVNFVAVMIEHCRDFPESSAWLIADSRAVDRYGIGAAPPFPLLLKRFVNNGYLKRASSLTELAQMISVPPDALQTTVARFNYFAERGKDEDFQRGESAYERACGDASVTPNPSLGPLLHPPFYAVQIFASDIGTFAGLKTDANAQVLTKDGQAIAGLYAVGNDAASAFGGTYPAAGITVGLALTFGYVAAKHIAETPETNQHRPAA